MAVNFSRRVCSPVARSSANKRQQGFRITKTIKLALFTKNKNAVWAAFQELAEIEYNGLLLELPFKRDAFQLKPGDLFEFTYKKGSYNIDKMICRVTGIDEGSLAGENITVFAKEEPTTRNTPNYVDYIDSIPEGQDYSLDVLSHIEMMESPHFMSGPSILLVPIAGMETGNEIGYFLHYSIAGTSYNQLGGVAKYQQRGTLDSVYPADTNPIDRDVGFEITFDAASADFVSFIESIIDDQLFINTNLALLGDELITFKTITPVSGTTYSFSTIVRARYDTEKVVHAAATEFYFLGGSYLAYFSDAQFLPGSTRYFKCVPYNQRQIGDLSAAIAEEHIFTGRALTPYRPINFKANGQSTWPTYEDPGSSSGGAGIKLTWSPRVRGIGAGHGDPDVVVDAAISWEGYFRVEVWDGTTLKRVTEDINDDEWTYTEAMNDTDFGSALGDEITFLLTNYISSDGVEYESAESTLIVKKI